jgi:hypothetical protein
MSKERKKIIKKLDTVFSKYIRERDHYKCCVCGVTSATHIIQCGHLFSRVSHSTRWDEKNALAQCAGCNLIHEHDFEPLRQAWLSRHSQKEYDLLYTKFKKSTKFTIGELTFLIKHYNNKLKELKDV